MMMLPVTARPHMNWFWMAVFQIEGSSKQIGSSPNTMASNWKKSNGPAAAHVGASHTVASMFGVLSAKGIRCSLWKCVPRCRACLVRATIVGRVGSAGGGHQSPLYGRGEALGEPNGDVACRSDRFILVPPPARGRGAIHSTQPVQT